MKINFILKPLLLILFLNITVAAALKPLTLILDWFPNPDHAPIFVAQEFGFFKAQGLSLNIIAPADPNDPPKLVAVGKADIAIGYPDQLIIDQHQGLPLVRLGTLIAAPLSCLVLRADSNIKTIKDLRGKTIGYSSPSEIGSLKVMLNYNGLTVKDVTLINVHFNLTQALLSKRVDAVTGMMRNFELIQMRLNHIPGRAFYFENNGVPKSDEFIYVINSNNKQDPRYAKFLTAIAAATQFLQKNPQLTWQSFAADHLELNNELNKQSWFATLPYFTLNPAAFDQVRWKAYKDFMLKENLM